MSAGQHPDNRLVHESSPYLLLHKNNPVDWYPWGQEALERARDEDRLIFLSVGYSTCYWCHVMERESFADETIAELMNREFVNIKLDREERPDLDEIYMTATQVLTQHGGWPNSVFLTPDLKPFFAGTYFPPEDRMGQPGFPRVLESMAEAWRSRRSEVETQAEGVADAVQRYLEERTLTTTGLPGADSARRAFEGLGRRYDARNGGFGGAPKFPTPANLLLLEAFLGDEPFAAQMLTETLDRMARGGLFDRLGGGFHRYATDDEWKIPHFEKMLYDNGLLLELYAREWQRNGNPETAAVLRETVGFLEREMTSESGAYYSALDAETGGVEGAFYVWTREELRGVLGDEDFGFLAPLYGFDVAPFFEERHYVLHLPASLADQARRRQMGLEELSQQIEPLRARLFEARAQREASLTDRKIMADWNGMAIAGVAEAGRLLPEPEFVRRAEAAADTVLAELRPEGRLLHVRRGEMEPVPAFLGDYVFLVHGLLALHEATGEGRWLESAADLTREQRERLEDSAGGFFVAAESRDVLFRSKEVFDGAVPASNSMAALNLIELARRTGDGEWSEAAARTLRSFGGVLEKLPDGGRTMALAAKRFADAGLASSEPASEVDSRPATPDAPATESPVAVSGRWLGEAESGGWREFEAVVEIADGWHLYAPSVESFPSVEVSSGSELRDLRYPAGNGDPLELDGESLEIYVGRVAVRGAAKVGDALVRLEVTYQACEESRCLAAETASFELPLD